MNTAEIGFVLIAFLGGVVSFASPCCLPLIPAYLGYMVGATDGGRADRRHAFTHGLAFVVGFSLVFVAFWASIGTIGYVFADNAKLLRQLGGAVLIFMGLHVAGVINIRALWRDTRPLPAFGRSWAGGTGAAGLGGSSAMVGGTGVGASGFGPGALAGTTTGASGFGTGALAGTAESPSYTRSLLFGTAFAAGWSPCIGPILGLIIGLASTTASVAQGTALLVAYAAGLAVPFLAVALGAGWVSRRLTWVGRHERGVNLVSGALLVLVGALMVTNTLSRLGAFALPLGA